MKWLRQNLFPTWWQTALTLLLVYLFIRIIFAAFDWAVLEAVWRPDAKACRAGGGACWGFIAEKHRFILFGTYPYEQHWRPATASVLLIGLWILSALRLFWRWWLALVWAGGLTLIAALMWGGVFGLPYVENERWGGLILTLLLSSFGIAAAFPLSIVLALARRSGMPAIRGLAVGYIELVRGVPLISLLFMASVMLPLFLPSGVTIDKLLRAQLALIMFAAAYLAEVVRGGLQAIPREQYEAADALGLSYLQKTTTVVLPQALRIAVPPLVSTFIGFFKDTSLVLIIGLFDLLSTIKVALTDPAWVGFGVEAYVFASLVYFVFCFAMSQYSRRLERR
jgi:general L-amino acid transport system permease protein